MTAYPMTVMGLQAELASVFMLWPMRPTLETLKWIGIFLAFAVLLKLLGFNVLELWQWFKRYIVANNRPIYYNRAARRRFYGYL